MPAYLLKPNGNEYRLVTLQHRDELKDVAGKFVFFPKSTGLVIATTDLFHKQVADYAQPLLNPPETKNPSGYGRIEHGTIVSWKSNYFGTTPPDLQYVVEKILADLE